MAKKFIIPAICAVLAILAFAFAEMQQKTQLPEIVKDALMQAYPGSAIEEFAKEKECPVFEVELKLADGSEIELTAAADGTIMEVEKDLKSADLPFDLASVLPAGAQVKEVEGEVTYAVFKPVMLPQPRTTYEVMAVINGKTVEIKLSSDGTILSREAAEDDDDDDENDDDDDEDEDEDEDEDD